MPTLCHPDDLPQIGAHFEAIQRLDKTGVVSIEYRMRHKAGHWVWLLSYDTVFEWVEDGSVRSHIGIATDISAQKHAEEIAQHSQVRAERLAAEHQRTGKLQHQIMDTAQSAIIGMHADLY